MMASDRQALVLYAVFLFFIRFNLCSRHLKLKSIYPNRVILFSRPVMALFDLLARSRTTEQKLIDAVSSNDIELLEELLEDGVDLNKKVYKYGGDTALHLAATKGMTRVIEYLIHAGVNCEQPNDSGITPLYNAVRANHSSAVKLLLMHCKSDDRLKFLWSEDDNELFTISENVEMQAVEIISASNLLFQKGKSVSTLWDQLFMICENEILDHHGNMKLLFLTVFKHPNPSFLKYEKKVVKRIENFENGEIWRSLSEDEKLISKKKFNEVLILLQNMKKNPLSLAHLCRLTIRWSFWNKCNVYYGAWKLPLPTSLKNYIVFDGHS